jgi:hypothetical protein
VTHRDLTSSLVATEATAVLLRGVGSDADYLKRVLATIPTPSKQRR